MKAGLPRPGGGSGPANPDKYDMRSANGGTFGSPESEESAIGVARRH